MRHFNQTIYQIFPRNFSKEGTFDEITKQLNRIKDLGVDIIYLMPIHEIGVLARKGTYGSPYAIKDYYSISPDLGTLEQFKNLINETHKLGMKIIIDMVFNHTSPDNVLIETNPEYYFYKNGKRGNRVGDWSDIVDLDNYREDTRRYLCDVLKYWIEVGVDGFRFDVCSMIPLDFFKMARKELGDEVIFFGEAVDPVWAKGLRERGETGTPDEDSFPTFDSLYNYTWYGKFRDYFAGNATLKEIIDIIDADTKLLPDYAIRANCLENHDVDRVAHTIKDENLYKSWVRFSFMLKGNAFIYAGQEYGISHKPELFEKDPIEWPEENEIYQFYKDLIKEKHSKNITENNLSINGNVVTLNGEDFIL